MSTLLPCSSTSTWQGEGSLGNSQTWHAPAQNPQRLCVTPSRARALSCADFAPRPQSPPTVPLCSALPSGAPHTPAVYPLCLLPSRPGHSSAAPLCLFSPLLTARREASQWERQDGAVVRSPDASAKLPGFEPRPYHSWTVTYLSVSSSKKS